MQYASSEAVDLHPTAAMRRQDSGVNEQATPRSRRVFHCSAALKLARFEKALIVKTIMLTETGIFVLHDKPLPQQDTCTIQLSMFIGGKRVFLSATGCIGEAVCAGETFRIGIRFTQLDEQDAPTLAGLLRG